MGNNNTSNLPPAKFAFNHKKNDFRSVCRYSGSRKRKIAITNQLNLTENDYKDKQSLSPSPSQDTNIISSLETQAFNKQETLSNKAQQEYFASDSCKGIKINRSIYDLNLHKNVSEEWISSSIREDKCIDLVSTLSAKESFSLKRQTLPTYNTDMMFHDGESYASSSILDFEHDFDRNTKFETFIELEKLANNTKGYEVHSAEAIRSSYYNKLIKNQLFGEIKPKTFHNVFIASWDDTLFCTSYLSPQGMFFDKLKVSEKVKIFMEKLEFSLVRLLTLAMNNGCDVYIVSDAKKGWIEESIQNFLPKVQRIIDNYSCDKISLIYTEDFIETQNKVSNVQDLSKARTEGIKSIFSKYQGQSTLESFYNIICFSDSLSLIQSLSEIVQIVKDDRIILAGNTDYEKTLDRESNIYLKTLKLKEEPEIEDLIKQQNLIADQFRTIYGAIRNINIKVKVKK